MGIGPSMVHRAWSLVPVRGVEEKGGGGGGRGMGAYLCMCFLIVLANCLFVLLCKGISPVLMKVAELWCEGGTRGGR